MFMLLGYTPEELSSERTHFLRMTHPDDVGRIERGWRQACLSGAEVWEDRWRARHRDGAYRWIHGRARRVSDPVAPTIVWVGVSVGATTEMASDPVGPGVGWEPA